MATERSPAADGSRDDKWRGIVKMLCQTCGGTGKDVYEGKVEVKCNRCDGTGYRMPTDAEINLWLGINVMRIHPVELAHRIGGKPLAFLTDANQALMLTPRGVKWSCGATIDIYTLRPFPAEDADPGYWAIVEGERAQAHTPTEARCLASALATVAKQEGGE